MINNLSEDYVSFQVAKLLKEKGFDIYSESYYLDNTKKLIEHVGCYNKLDQEKDNPHSIRPTHSLAIKWIRENFKLEVEVRKTIIGYTCYVIDCSSTSVREWRINKVEPSNLFQLLEEATEAAIKYALENLIK